MDKIVLFIRLARFLKRLNSLSLFALLTVLAVLIIVLIVFVFIIIKRSRVEVRETKEERAKRLEKERRANILSRIKESFKSSLLFLKDKISGKDYRYQLPWFLILGESLSGKSEILKNLGLETQAPEAKAEDKAEDLEKASGVRWWFYDKGAVIEPQGDLILKTDIEDSDEDSFVDQGWRRLIKLLKKHRPRRPLDGVIVTISCSDLLIEVGEEARIKDGLKWKANILYNRLRELQRQLAFDFPVYVIFTKCDQVTGFAPFARQLPVNLQNGIWGWSNPYALDAPYSADWPEEGMRDIEADLFEAQLEFFAGKPETEESDEVSLLCSSFSKLSCSVQLSLDTIFKDSSFQESFFFRGFFFTGSVVNQPQEPKRPVFLRDLFDKKIFLERGVGKIVDKTFVSKHRAVRLTQLSCVLILLISALGMSNAYFNLSEERRVELPVLDLIANSLLELEYKKTVDRSMFEEKGLNVLNGMSEIDPFVLTSIFLPSSWSLDLQSRIVSCMTIAYEKIIMRMIFIEFSNKARNIISLREEEGGDDAGRKVNIRKSLEFTQLQYFMKSLVDFEKNLSIYNSQLVLGKANSKEFIQVVAYLYGIDLKGPFSLEALSQLRGSPITTQSLRGDVNSKIWDLSNSFYKRAYKNNILRRKLILLNTLLKNIYSKSFENTIKSYTVLSDAPLIVDSHGRGKSDNDNGANIVVRFKSLLIILKDIEKDFVDPGYAWIVSNRFDMFPDFRETLELVWNSAFLGREVYKQLNKQGERGLKSLQYELREQQTRLTGPLLVAFEEQDASEDLKTLSLSKVKNLKSADDLKSEGEVLKGGAMERGKRGVEYGKNLAFFKPPPLSSFHVPVELRYSDRVMTLKKALEDFFGMEFTNVLRTHSQMLTELPVNKRLVWNTRLLEKAAKLYDPFMVFLTENLKNFPSELQPVFEQVAGEILEANIMDNIGASQRLEDTLEAVNPSFRKEMLRVEVLNFKDAYPHISRLLEIFDSLEFHEANRNLFRLSATQGNRILRQVDQLLMEGDFYMTKNRDFDWWNGKKSPALEAYNVNDQEELKFYFSVQQKRIRFLVNEYAIPIVNLLGVKNKYRGYIDLSLVSRWERIITAFKDFEEKKPGNSIDTLESFILSGLDEIAGKDCDKEIPARVLTAKSGDFFLNQRNIIRKRLYQRCQKLSFENDFKTY